jgi:hypothetical protein
LIFTETIMECPHLAGDFMKYCVAEKAVYLPSIYELREYCSHQQHRVCQFYLRSSSTVATCNDPVCDDISSH